MELYKFKDQIQEFVDYTNGYFKKDEDEILGLSELTTDTLVCPINQSIPEKYFNTLDCEIATTKRRAYLIGITKGDIVVHYVGPRRNEIRDFIINYTNNNNYENIQCALRDKDGNKGLVYAPIKDGIEFAIYGPNKFNCNNEELTKSSNEKKINCRVSIDSLAIAIEEEFNIKLQTKIPTSNYSHVKNNRGILKSCGNGKNVFELTTKRYNVKVPAVLDEEDGAIKPKSELLGFGHLNNTRLIENDTYYIGELDIHIYDGEEEEIKSFLEEKGGVEWIAGTH